MHFPLAKSTAQCNKTPSIRGFCYNLSHPFARLRLKEKLYRKLGKAQTQDEGRNQRSKLSLAEQLRLPVVNGKVAFPDVRIEYANQEMEISRVDLELATGHYHAQHLAEKARAGFQIYARSEDAAGLRRVFLDGALGTRRGELGALRWSDCNFDSMSFSVQHSYYWRRGGHLKATKTEASAKVLPMHLALKGALLEWKSQSDYNGPGDFVFPSRRHNGKKPLDLAAVLKRKIQPAFVKVGITGVGWQTFRHTVGTMLAEMGEHQLTIRDYLRHSNLHVTNKYLQATPQSKRLAQGKLVDAILPGGLLSASKSTLIQ